MENETPFWTMLEEKFPEDNSHVIFVTHKHVHAGFRDKLSKKWIMTKGNDACCNVDSIFIELQDSDILQWKIYSDDLFSYMQRMEKALIAESLNPKYDKKSIKWLKRKRV